MGGRGGGGGEGEMTPNVTYGGRGLKSAKKCYVFFERYELPYKLISSTYQINV
jgi:hypothetical protein